MITMMMLLAAVTISSVDENAIIRSVMDRYFTDKRSHPDARQSVFIAETLVDGELDVRTLLPSARSGENVRDLAESIVENNRAPIPLPELSCTVRRASRAEVMTNGRYDWGRIQAPAVVEVSRPGFTQKGCVAVVRVVVRQPEGEAKQEVYTVERKDDGWRVTSYGGGFVRE
jgi:hypothetical protein